jgi:hypothetical protein
MRPAKTRDAAAWDDDDGEEEKIDLTTLFECDGNAEEDDDGAFDASYGIAEQPESSTIRNLEPLARDSR